jgi:hypothetical protein
MKGGGGGGGGDGVARGLRDGKMKGGVGWGNGGGGMWWSVDQEDGPETVEG